MLIFFSLRRFISSLYQNKVKVLASLVSCGDTTRSVFHVNVPESYLSVVELTIYIDLPFCNITCQIWDGMGDIYKQQEKEMFEALHHVMNNAGLTC